MAQPQRMTPERESQFMEAHREGMRRALEVCLAAFDHAQKTYPDDEATQDFYIAGLVQELRRLTKKRDASTDQGEMPWCPRCQCYHHDTAPHITRVRP